MSTFVSMHNTPALHERLAFDMDLGEIRDGPRRYLVMRTDVLMGAFDRLPPAVRLQALESLAASVQASGGDSVRAYLAESGPEHLLATMARASLSLGWGSWRFETSPDELRLFVHNSPFAAATTQQDAPACHAIVGMLRAVSTALWHRPVKVCETSCACQHPSTNGYCTFEARTSTSKSLPA